MTDGERVAEGSVAVMGGVRVGVANVMQGAYELADGSERTGLTAMLFLDDGRKLTVGQGSMLDVGDEHWQVAEVTLDRRDRAAVRFVAA